MGIAFIRSRFPRKHKRDQTFQQSREIGGSWPKKRRTNLCWFISTIGWGALLCLGLLFLLQQAFAGSQRPNDFCQDYIASQRVIQNIPVYHPLHCWAGIVAIPTPVEYDSHPPTAVLFFYLLGFLPVMSASMIWGFACLAAYLASGFWLLKELGWLSLRGSALFVLGSLLWEPVTAATLLENYWQVVTLLLVAAWLLERRGHLAWAGGILGLASLLKIWPAILLASGIIQKRWKQVVCCSLTLVLGTILSLLVLGPSAFVAYWGPVQTNEELWVPNTLNVSLEGAIARLFLGAPGHPYKLAPLIPGLSATQVVLFGELVSGMFLLGSLVLIWWCTRNHPSEPEILLSQSLFVTVLLLIFPISWRWSLITLLLPVAMILLALRQLPRLPAWQLVLLWGGLIPLLLRFSWIGGVVSWLAQYNARLAFSVFSLTTLGLLLFIGMQASLLRWARSKDKTITLRRTQC